AAAFPAVLAPADPAATDYTLVLRPPSVEHPFGTDQLGAKIVAAIREADDGVVDECNSGGSVPFDDVFGGGSRFPARMSVGFCCFGARRSPRLSRA
ncbi:hypothetical protein RA997_23055, partial [Mycobacteroides abscessus subsp. abscessus]